MIDPSTRLRRAIYLKDALLVKRIIQSHPRCLKNPDFDDKSNSSLHLAAELGLVNVAQVLLDAGHDRDEISRNTDFSTPLMLAIERGNVDVAHLLINHCARCIPWVDHNGMDALSIAAAHPSSASLVPILLSHPTFPSSIRHLDHQGNTPLHHASASGSLKTLRTLLEAGADPTALNSNQWPPLAYSQTVQAEVYFKQLITEIEAAKRAPPDPTTPGSTHTLTRAHTTDADPVSFGSPSPIARDKTTPTLSARQSQPILKQQGSRADLLRRGGVRLVNSGDEAEPRPATADPSATGWSPRSSSRMGPNPPRPGYFDAGRLRSSSGSVPTRKDSLGLDRPS